jgi:heptosyltransferase-1
VKEGAPRFLIVRLGSLGDVIHAIPAVAALRRRYPEARLDWLVDPAYVGLLDLVGGIDERIGLSPRGAIMETLATVARLRRTRYDVAIDLQGLLKSAVLARASGARRVLGFSRRHLREPLAASFYTNVFDPASGPAEAGHHAGAAVHVIHKNLGLLQAVDVTDDRVMFPLQIPDTETADRLAERVGGEYAVLNPGAAWPNKRWPAQSFGALAAAIRDRRGIRSVVIWGPGEQALAQAVVAASGGAAELSPPTSIGDLFGLVRRARLLVSGDTGPLHIGGAVGTPIVALFGPTRSERNGPWAAEDISVSRLDRCACHYERRCRLASPCIDSITVDEVVAAVERRLDVDG